MNRISIHNSREELEITERDVLNSGMQQHIFTCIDGTTLPYCQFISEGSKNDKYSLLIFFHGAGSVGTDNWKHVRIPGPPIIDFLAKNKIKAIVIFPQCPEGYKWVDVPWDSTSHIMPENSSVYMKKAMELFEKKLVEYPVDQSGIYVGGISMGGYGAWDFACRFHDTVCAVFPICGGADTTKAGLLKDIGVYTIHGDNDAAVPVSRSRDMVSALMACGNNNVHYREIPGLGHNAWTPAFADEQALKWLFTQKKVNRKSVL